MANIRLPFFGQHQATGFDYLALLGFAINMVVIASIVFFWITN